MRPRPNVAVLLVSAAVVVAAISWWVGNSTLHADAQPMTDPPTIAAKATSTEPVEPLPSNIPVAPNASLEDEDDGLADEDLWSHISDPANSDLPPDVFNEVTQLGVDLVRTDATGHRRGRWPEYWRHGASARAAECCTDVVIHAAGGFTDPANPDVVNVTVVWGAREARAGSVRVTNVALRRTDEGWSPTHE